MTQFLVEQYVDKIATHTIEVPVTASGRCPLPVDEILRNKRIVSVSVMDNPNDDAVSPSGAVVVSPQTLRTSYFDLKQLNDATLASHPVTDLVRRETDSALRIVNICSFNPSKSTINIGFTATTSAAVIQVGRVFVITFTYVR
ncbi:MAG: hypothetical protein AAFY91_12735 [Bacteroidota bacterium]